MPVNNPIFVRSEGLRPPVEGHVIVGRIKGGWGLKGDLKVEVFSDIPSRFARGSVIYLKGNPAKVERSRHLKGDLLVKFDTVSDRTVADSLRHEVLTVPEDASEPLPDGLYYHYQIIDMDVKDEDGESLGVINEIISTGGNDVYVIRKDGTKDLLIPAIDEVVLDVDVENNLMRVRIPEGLV